MSVIFLNRYFYPDHSATSQMVSDLAFALTKRGHRVRVITSRQRYEAPEIRLPARETVAGVDIHRIWTSHFGRRNLIGRAVDYATFYVMSAWALWRLARKEDVVVAKTDPPMLSVFAAPIAALHGSKLVNWIQDVFPEVATALGVGNGRLSRWSFRLMRILRDWSLRRAAMNVAVGEHMAEKIKVLGIHEDMVSMIANWADGALIEPREHSTNPLRAEWGLAGKFVVGYSGNLGRAHEYGTLLDAIERLERQRGKGLDGEGESAALGRGDVCANKTPDIVWLFIGGGALYEEFETEADRRRLRSVRFRPYQPRERLAESISAADVHLISLRARLEGLVVPSKFYGIEAAGRPVIFIGDKDGEIARLIARHQCGRTVAEGDGAELARAVLELAADPMSCRQLGEQARQAFTAEYDKCIAVTRWEHLLAKVSGLASTATQCAGRRAPASFCAARKAW
jgi:glycosyltransferase involved in cell wall biosynthesis